MRTSLVLAAASVLVVAHVAAAEPPVSHADLAVQPYIPLRVAAEPLVKFSARIVNYGPDDAANVVVRSSGRVSGGTCRESGPGKCVIPFLAARAEEAVTISFSTDGRPSTLALEISATAAIHDPNPRNNSVRASVEVTRAPHMRFYLYGPVADPGGIVEYVANIRNESLIEATNVAFTIPLPDGWQFESADDLRCSTDGRTLRCSVPRLAPSTTLLARFRLRAAPALQGSPYKGVPVQLTTDYGVLGEPYEYTSYFAIEVARHLVVTSTADDGEGTLRNAIDTANAECHYPAPPCKIVFDLAEARAWNTIRPSTPLPAIRTYLTIDGSTQTRLHGDTNASGPEVEINGGLLTTGDGFEVSSGSLSLRDVTVNGFPGNGVSVVSPAFGVTIERCYIGTDSTGTIAVPNALRGVSADVAGAYYSVNVAIRNSVISGNGRSGIFIYRGIGSEIVANRIGTTASDPPQPLGNGATGIFFGPQTTALVQKNVIAFNAAAGIGSDPKAEWIAIRGNSIFANGTLGIDHGIDGVTPNATSYRVITNYPVLTVARYDPASGRTRIEGTVDEPYFASVSAVELFASTGPSDSGHVEGEQFLGRIPMSSKAFAFDYEGDLRGRFITATFTRPNGYYPELPGLGTSEFSAAVRVEGEAAAPIDRAAVLPRGSDLWLQITPYRKVPAGSVLQFYTSIIELGPERAENVSVEFTTDGGRLRAAQGSRCSEIPGGVRCEPVRYVSLASVGVNLETPADRTHVQVRARVTASTFDPDPANNVSVVDIELTDAPGLSLAVQSPGPVDPGADAVYTVAVTHSTAIDARDVVITIPNPARWPLIESPSGNWSCTSTDDRIVCRSARVAAGTTESFRYVLRAPSGKDGLRPTFQNVRITSAAGLAFEPAAYVRYEIVRVVDVTSPADDGPGSLRAAIGEVNENCRFDGHCRIAFAGAMRLAPSRPLPRITGRGVIVDARAGGGTDIDGSAAGTANGLEIVSAGSVTVRGLTIHGFALNGIEVRREPGPFSYTERVTIADCASTGNALRGIAVTSHEVPAAVDMVANTVSANGRAGVFVASGDDLRITGNRLEANGASGIYIGQTAGALIEGNEITGNNIGVAFDRAANFNSVRNNSIHGNGGLGIDHGIDGPTLNDARERRAELPPFPLILSARWDAPANGTRVEGIVTGVPSNGATVQVFSNAEPDESGYGEAELLVGEVVIAAGGGEQRFELVIPEDLRGRFVTATHTRSTNFDVHGWTSEISPAVPVR